MGKIEIKPKIPLLILAAFALLYALISFVNHYLFRTAALDLGLYNHAIYDYAHLRLNNSPLIEPHFRFRNQLSDHFDLMLMLISPLSYVFGTYTLLVVQIAAILAGGWGIYRYFQPKNEWIARLAMLHFFLMWGIYSALAFDYHSNVIAAMLLPWILLFHRNKNWAKAVALTLLACFCKENMALWMAFVWFSLTVSSAFRKENWKAALAMAIACGLYFILAIKVWMPLFTPPGVKYIHFFFAALGKDPAEAVAFLFKHPLDAFLFLFIDPTNDPMGVGVKKELFKFVLLSGGFALLLRPQFLLMLIPIFAQKLWHDDVVKWGIYLQYSIEFAPVITIALFTWLSEKRPDKLLRPLLYATPAFALIMTLVSFGHARSKWYDSRRQNPFMPRHYRQPFDPGPVHRVLNKIPADLSVCASSHLTPHLTSRNLIYGFPFLGGNPDLYILLKNPESYYPCAGKTEYDGAVQQVKNNPAYESCYESGSLIVFKKKGLPFSL